MVVCPGDLQVVPVGLLEDPVGKFASAVYLLLPLATCPQEASNGELAATNRSEEAVPDLSRDRGVTEAVPVGLHMCLGRVEVGSQDFGTCDT